MKLKEANARIVAEVARRPVRNASGREIRTFKMGSAADAIFPLTPGIDLFCLTFGQFSLIDLLLAILHETGPAEVDLSTWIAAQADLDVVEELLGRAAIERFRLIVDNSFVQMKPERCRRVEGMFGAGCIRSMRTHAKFLRIQNEEWSIALRTSMNLNQNPRAENFELSDDPQLCEFLKQIVDDVFLEHPPGDFTCGAPRLDNVEQSKRRGEVETGRTLFADTPRLEKLRPDGVCRMD